MRLLRTFTSAQEALALHSRLLQEGIDSKYEMQVEEGVRSFTVWVQEERCVEQALKVARHIPVDPTPTATEAHPSLALYFVGETIHKLRPPPKRTYLWVLSSFVFLCGMVFFWGNTQQRQLSHEEPWLLPPLYRILSFDFPHAVEELDLFLQVHPLRTEQEEQSLTRGARRTLLKNPANPLVERYSTFLAKMAP